MTQLKKRVSRKTIAALPHNFGRDRNRRIVVTLIPGTDSTPDLIELRPERTKRPETLALIDVYQYAVRMRVNCARLEKAREKKAKNEERRRRLAFTRSLRRAAKEDAS